MTSFWDYASWLLLPWSILSGDSFRCLQSPWWVCECTLVFATRSVCVAKCKTKGLSIWFFCSVQNEPQASWATGERGSLENWELSSGTTTRPGIQETEQCKNTLILPGSSPSFCHWSRYQPINFLTSFPGSVLIPQCCQCEQPPCTDLCSRRTRTWSISPFF